LLGGGGVGEHGRPGKEVRRRRRREKLFAIESVRGEGGRGKRDPIHSEMQERGMGRFTHWQVRHGADDLLMIDGPRNEALRAIRARWRGRTWRLRPAQTSSGVFASWLWVGFIRCPMT